MKRFVLWATLNPEAAALATRQGWLGQAPPCHPEAPGNWCREGVLGTSVSWKQLPHVSVGQIQAQTHPEVKRETGADTGQAVRAMTSVPLERRTLGFPLTTHGEMTHK